MLNKKSIIAVFLSLGIVTTTTSASPYESDYGYDPMAIGTTDEVREAVADIDRGDYICDIVSKHPIEWFGSNEVINSPQLPQLIVQCAILSELKFQRDLMDEMSYHVAK